MICRIKREQDLIRAQGNIAPYQAQVHLQEDMALCIGKGDQHGTVIMASA